MPGKLLLLTAAATSLIFLFAVVHSARGHTAKDSVACRKLSEAAAERDSWPITVSKAEDVQFVKELVDEVSGWLQARL